jgi:hypothetical protein
MVQAPVPVYERFTEEQKAQVCTWFGEGKTQKEIGELLGEPRRTIGKLFVYLGLHRDQKEAQKSRLDPGFVLFIIIWVGLVGVAGLLGLILAIC